MFLLKFIDARQYLLKLITTDPHAFLRRSLALMKNSNDTTGNRTRDLPTCSAVPQPTALPRGPFTALYKI
jgi:hypothetical protein